MGTKTSKSSQVYRVYEISIDGVTGAVTVQTNSIYYASVTNSRTAFGLPDWKQRIKAGQSATTSLVGSRYFFRQMRPSFSYAVFKQPDGKVVSTCISYMRNNAPSFNVGQLASTTANNLALRNIHQKVTSTRTQFQGGIFLGELRETIRMLKSPAKSLHEEISRYTEKIARSTLSAPKKSLKKIISDTYLEWQYGVRPLVKDLDDAHKAYYHLTERESRTRIQATGTEQQESYPYTNYSDQIGPNISGLLDMVDTQKMAVRYIVGMRIKSAGAPFNPVSERLGLTLDQFLPTVWELLPWSFLVDYFTNIGDIVAATATNQSDVLWINKTVRGENTRIVRTKINYADMKFWYPNAVCGGTAGEVITVYTYVTRSGGGNTLALPQFVVSLPGSAFQYANIAALVTSGLQVSRNLRAR